MLDKIESSLDRQSKPGLPRQNVLKAFEWFRRESSLGDARLARALGFYPLTFYLWKAQRCEPDYASVKKIEMFLRENAPEYLRSYP